MEALIKAFERAGLLLKMASEPFARSAEDVFGMDIDRKIKGYTRTEFFRIWPGHKDNRIEVVGADKNLRQLVLLVHEPARTFTADVPFATKQRHGEQWFEKFLAEYSLTKKDVVQKDDYKVIVRRTAPSRKRHYLCGVDERQLFIAQLPKAVSTVRDAHACLKTSTVTLAEGKMSGRTVRQGEWFFLNISEAEAEAIKSAIHNKQAFIEKKVAIGAINDPFRKQRAGNPHVADEIIKMPAPRLNHGFSVLARPDIFVRGKVRHKDHETVSFKTWRRVIRNTESNAGQMAGIAWID